ncbi:MAG: GNAT family N-acetyltransferase [Ferruginibacter sp.]
MDIVLQTERLFFRRFTMEDSALLLELNSDPEVVKYVHEVPLKNLADAKAVLKDIILPQYALNLGRWAMHLKTNLDFIGWCGLKYIEENKEIDLGYRLMKTYWGKGYASEAAKATLNYAHKKLNFAIVTGKVHVKNIASQKVLEKIGMQYEKEELEDNCPIKIYRFSI